MKRLYITFHLGLGDALIYNALVRHLAQRHDEVIIPVKRQNALTVDFMFRDLPNVNLHPVTGDDEMLSFAKRFNGEVLRLGMFGKDFSFHLWDRVMYRQAGIDFEERWTGFQIVRSPETEVLSPPAPFVFLHDDAERGFRIPQERRPGGVFGPWKTKTIFEWQGVLESAEEIHCIDSCFAILADSIPTKATKLVLHLYSRKDAKPPTYRKNWQVLTQ